MSGDERFWERVDRALDERRDPLADENVCALLEARPERLGELAVLLEQLATVERTHRSPRGRRRAASAALLAFAAGAGALWFARDPSSAAVATDLHSATVVHSFEVSYVREGDGRRTTTRSDGERTLVRAETLAMPRALQDLHAPSVIALVDSVSFQR